MCVHQGDYFVDENGKIVKGVETLGSRLRQLRIGNQLRQDQVGRIIGLNKNAISSYENDKRQPPYDVLVRLASLYRVSTDYLLGNQPSKTIDVTQLDQEDLAVVTNLINHIENKNRIIKDLKCYDG